MDETPQSHSVRLALLEERQTQLTRRVTQLEQIKEAVKPKSVTPPTNYSGRDILLVLGGVAIGLNPKLIPAIVGFLKSIPTPF